MRTTGQDFLQTCPQFLGLHLSALTMAIRSSLSSFFSFLRDILAQQRGRFQAPLSVYLLLIMVPFAIFHENGEWHHECAVLEANQPVAACASPAPIRPYTAHASTYALRRSLR